MYNSATDAKTVLQNSGVYEMFDFDVVSEKTVYDWMYQNDATPELAAEHFNFA